MSYINRHGSKRTAGSPELLYLVIVLVAGVGTAMYASQKIGTDFSSITAVVSMLGLGRTAQPIRYDPRAATTSEQGVANVITQTQETDAPFCEPGQKPSFALGLSQLKTQLGDTMGAAVECEHPSTATGDTLQQTTTGLAAYIKRTNTVTFTDGWRHWALTPSGVTTWEGTASEPPAA